MASDRKFFGKSQQHTSKISKVECIDSLRLILQCIEQSLSSAKNLKEVLNQIKKDIEEFHPDVINKEAKDTNYFETLQIIRDVAHTAIDELKEPAKAKDLLAFKLLVCLDQMKFDGEQFYMTLRENLLAQKFKVPPLSIIQQNEASQVEEGQQVRSSHLASSRHSSGSR